MTVTGADISLSEINEFSTTYRRKESLLVGFSTSDEYSEETIQSGRTVTRTQGQGDAFSGETLLDRFQQGQNLNALPDTQTEYLSSLRDFQADFETN